MCPSWWLEDLIRFQEIESANFPSGSTAGQRLVFRADHDPVPTREDGGIDWNSVTAVQIVEIGDYHGG